MFRLSPRQRPMAIWKVTRRGSFADVAYLNTVRQRSFACGTVTNAEWWLILEAVVDRLEPAYGEDYFWDADQVWTFLPKPRGRS